MLKEFAEASVKRAGMGFDPTVIITIITTIMNMIANCKKPAAEAVRAGNVGPFQRARVASGLMQAGGIRMGKAISLSKAICDEAIERQHGMQAGTDGDWCDLMAAEAEKEA